MSAHRVIGVAGFKNSGKTTLVERLVSELTARGYRVSTVKHAHHTFDVDHEGRDSHRHRQAGASQVAVVSRTRWALISELRGEDEPSLEEILSKLAPCDLVVIEGYKGGTHDKIEVHNAEDDNPYLFENDHSIKALACNGPVENCPVPVYDRNDIQALADFVCGRTGLVEVPQPA